MEIVPYKSLGPLSLGEKKSQCRNQLGSSFESFRKSSFAENETDAFEDYGLHLSYDAADRLKFIEAFGPSVIVFRGIRFFERHIDDVREDVRLLGFRFHALEDGVYLSEEAGISVYAPSGLFESVSVFVRGYYDFLFE